MYVDNGLKTIKIQWTEIVTHTYHRISRAKWKIEMNYVCGAHMTLENQPDDLIQCLLLGAFNSGKTIRIEERAIAADAGHPAGSIESYRDLQPLLLS